MTENSEIAELKNGLSELVDSLEYLKTTLGKSMGTSSPLNTPALTYALHEVHVCTGQNIEALLKLNMVLQDLL